MWWLIQITLHRCCGACVGLGSGGHPIELLNWDIGSEAVRCSLRLESLPYTADVKQHVYIKEFLLTVTLWAANGESKPLKVRIRDFRAKRHEIRKTNTGNWVTFKCWFSQNVGFQCWFSQNRNLVRKVSCFPSMSESYYFYPPYQASMIAVLSFKYPAICHRSPGENQEHQAVGTFWNALSGLGTVRIVESRKN